MSPLRSAPETLQRFLLSHVPRPNVLPRMGTSKAPRQLEPSDCPPLSISPATPFSRPILSASMASSSASGESGIVSRLEMLGLLDLAVVGVEDTGDDGIGTALLSLEKAW